MNTNMHDDVESVLLTAEQISEITSKLGAVITEDYKNSKN